ncbi:hypothetical protein QVD17_41486 [Tagetes erecta]|uniref:Uncharacterized protein n=1 Tax=Tagetes erecta TaxID=13708 RepID=A0AAD8JPD1_TARER|nr:hypothetical protein QVD17_41486 [Tagetes erecta]
MPLSLSLFLSHLNRILSKSFLTLPIFFTIDSSGFYFFISHSLLISAFFFFSSFHLLSMPTTPVAPPPSLPVGPTSPSLIGITTPVCLSLLLLLLLSVPLYVSQDHDSITNFVYFGFFLLLVCSDLIHVLNIKGLFDFEDVATGSLTG